MSNNKVKFHHQLEANDCGPACIQMICEFYGKKYKLSDIKRHLNISKLGVSVKEIRYFLDIIGFNSATVKINLEDAKEMPLPAILYLNYGHFVILEKIISKNGKLTFLIVDPSFGKLKLDEEAFLIKWLNVASGLAIILEPNEHFATKNIKTTVNNGTNPIVGDVREVVKKNKFRFSSVLFLTIIALLANWAMPLLLKNTIDQGILQKDFDLLWKLLLFQFIFAISYLLSESISEILTTKISLDINIDLNKSYFRKILSLPLSYYDSKFKSDLIEGLNDQKRINSLISSFLIGILIMLLNIIVFSILLISYNYQVFLIFILFTALSMTYTFFFFKKKKIIDYSLFSLESENRNNIYELIMGISEVKINSAEESRLSNWRNTEDKLKKLKIKSAYIDFFMSDGNSFIAKLRDIVLLGVCAFLVIDDNMTMGVMLMVSYVLGQLSGPFNDLIRYIQNLQMIKLSFNRLSDVYLKEEEIDKNKRYSPLSNNNSILLENVSFQYGTSASELVLDKINLEIPNNKTTAIVGESGSGKSTLLKLFLGFYYPTFGNLYVGNNKITDINLKDWRKKCGVIMQEGYIFSGSILQNVTLSTLEPNREKFIQSLKIAELFDKMETLPMKEHTKIGEAGVSLSGGEKQRLLIARAVYKNPDFVFMDEATSSMDTIMEKNIMNNLKDFLQNRTAVIIAHRLSTIKNADNIIVMSDGEIVEQGTHSQLLGLKGKYYALVENQLESDPGKMAAHNIV
ncbi:MAG TPA: hypothetical protein DEQ87_09735 [Algoriphagus sp.]|jgi:ATP-binding cassette, subfamily B, bacterial|uniref:peptidase domain-containing ABC transporter n=1 Tax=Algoriphagus sp. TaxID=1872435 RepID=UPI000C61F881|nr:peptidase domain-containing ABC transporter [Algoriphagus sp.]MAL15858.1 hypothetical protein [Algoriphagus sp.]HCD87906.1 hypothetical protein [Algoriphagus sp.]|tara:strand:+ start:1392 stop:3617 length:2226 start_codon:yes stop_codon:yes gene_type:complete